MVSTISPSSSCLVGSLGDDLAARVLAELSPCDLAAAAAVSHRWRQIAYRSDLWQLHIARHPWVLPFPADPKTGPSARTRFGVRLKREACALGENQRQRRLEAQAGVARMAAAAAFGSSLGFAGSPPSTAGRHAAHPAEGSFDADLSEQLHRSIAAAGVRRRMRPTRLQQLASSFAACRSALGLSHVRNCTRNVLGRLALAHAGPPRGAGNSGAPGAATTAQGAER